MLFLGCLYFVWSPWYRQPSLFVRPSVEQNVSCWVGTPSDISSPSCHATTTVWLFRLSVSSLIKIKAQTFWLDKRARFTPPINRSISRWMLVSSLIHFAKSIYGNLIGWSCLRRLLYDDSTHHGQSTNRSIGLPVHQRPVGPFSLSLALLKRETRPSNPISDGRLALSFDQHRLHLYQVSQGRQKLIKKTRPLYKQVKAASEFLLFWPFFFKTPLSDYVLFYCLPRSNCKWRPGNSIELMDMSEKKGYWNMEN